jgi:hypothetical protein
MQVILVPQKFAELILFCVNLRVLRAIESRLLFISPAEVAEIRRIDIVLRESAGFAGYRITIAFH